MNRTKHTNEELEKAAGEIIRGAAIPASEIDRIVSSPFMFNAVKRRIEAERETQERKSFWSGVLAWPSLNGFNRAMAVGAVTLLFLAVTITVMVATKKSVPVNEQVAGTVPPARQKPDEKKTAVEIPAPFIDNETGNETPRATEASYKREPVRQERPAPRRAQVKKSASPTFDAQGDFFPVTYGGGSDEIAQHGGQIVRTEIPRSSLFAMGVDVPVESANEKIKTDLLIGADGVVRGVRIVK